MKANTGSRLCVAGSAPVAFADSGIKLGMKCSCISEGQTPDVTTVLRELQIMKIGFLSMPLTGHLHPMTALGRKMQARGHEVIFFGLPDAARIVQSAGLDFVPFGEEKYPVGTTPAMYAHLAMLKGEDVVRYSFQEMHPQRTRITLEQLPEKLVHRGVEALVIDTIHFCAELVPMSMGIPYAHIWNVLHIDSSGATPAL